MTDASAPGGASTSIDASSSVDARSRVRRYRPSLVAVSASTLLGNALIAGVITVLLPQAGSFTHNLIYSECIGMSILAVIYTSHTLLPGDWATSAKIHLGVSVVGAVVGFAIGSFIGSRLVGDPMMFLDRWARSNIMWPILVIAALATSVYAAAYWFRQEMLDLKLQASEERSRAEAAQRQASEAQLATLRAQLEPHMLFNTLANLRALIALDPPAAQAMLDRLIAFLRATLSSSRRERVTLADEFAVLDDYLQLMAIRLGSRMQIELRLPDALREVLVLPLLLQPLVENAVKHGIEPSEDGGAIHVEAMRVGDDLQLRVVNSGIGYVAPAYRSSTGPGGFGLSQIRERLANAFGERAALRIGPLKPGDGFGDGACGTCAVLTAPWPGGASEDSRSHAGAAFLPNGASARRPRAAAAAPARNLP